MNTTTCHRDYDGSIIHDAEDNLYHGKILGIRGFVIYHGDTPEQARAIFREAVDDYLNDFEKEGRTPPMPFAAFPANLSHDLLVKAALFAHEHQIDIESVLQSALSDYLQRAA